MVNPDITSCIGFAFPKLPQNDCLRNEQSVLQVKVTWDMKKFSFVYELQPLPVDVVHTALKKALDMNESQSRQLRVTKFAKEMYLA